MSIYGLRVWDANGNLEIDISSRLPRLMGIVTIQTPIFPWGVFSMSINYPFSGISNNGDWFLLGVPEKSGGSISSNYFTIKHSSSSAPGVYLIKVFKL